MTRTKQDSSPGYSHASKRKAYKRALSGGSDNHSEPERDEYIAPSRPKRPPLKRSKTYQSATQRDSEEEMDVDVDVETVQDTAHGGDEASFDNRDGDSGEEDPHRVSKGKSSKKASSGGKKRQAVVWSDDEDEEDDAEAYKPPIRSPEQAEDDDGSLAQDPPSKSSRAKAKSTLPTGRIPKKKTTSKETAETLFKDERKPKTTTSRQDQRKRSSKEDQDDDYASPGSPSIDIDTTDDKPFKDPSPPPQTRKKKLPPIRKTKQPTEQSAKPSASQPATKASSSQIVNDLGLPLAKPSGASRGPNLGADLDLTNSSVYASLFKQTTGNTPRSGINRRERDDERQKELNKQREEARAKRAQEAKVSFSLQSQHDKIARWEERLRANKSSVLFPNYIAAKFKEEYERDKRREERGANGDHPGREKIT